MAVRYLVNNVEEAMRFYTESLGFVVKHNWGPVCILTNKDVDLWISGPSSSAGRTDLNGQKPLPGGSNRVVVKMPHLHQKLEELKQSSVPILTEVVKSPAGLWVVVADPSGNPVELFEPKD